MNQEKTQSLSKVYHSVSKSRKSMSHTIYATSAYVLRVHNVGEANRLFTLLTQDFGTISATAQSIRLEKSKLRFALQKFSFTEVLLVRGRGGWRITNAYPKENIYFDLHDEKQRIVIDITNLLKRLVVGELFDRELFDLVSDGFTTLRSILPSETRVFELVFVSKILIALGYGAESGIFEKFASLGVEDESLRVLAHEKRSLVLKEINSALSSSGL